jgi:cytochrome c2
MFNMNRLRVLIIGVALAAGPRVVLAAGDAAKGKAVFQQCSVCHNADSTERKIGPGLKGLFKKAKLASNGKPVNDANVLAIINSGGNGMPAYKEMLNDLEKDNLIAYLKTL